ncbi:D-alanyl-D-alanine carboxypeptidase [Streptomyces sp. NPDC127110]|uniref:D-alanyl-D-alanine carboxypeptidase n=1 Tax=Streptomyces sp. NPDC127110 TaxID=3345362 RepID=UPI00362C6B32
MKAETVANGAQAGRNPEEGEPGPDSADALAGREPNNAADALAGREPKNTADALAGREPQSTAPEPETDALAGPEAQSTADALAGREPKSTAADPQTDTPTRTLTRRETTTPAPEADTPAGREPEVTVPEPETDTPTRTLTRRETTAPEPEADGSAGQEAAPADPRVRGLAGREPKVTVPASESDTPAGALAGRGAPAPEPEADGPDRRPGSRASAGRGAEGADAGAEGGARAGRGSADALAQREAADAETEPGNDAPAGREAADAAPADRGSAADTPAQREVGTRSRSGGDDTEAEAGAEGGSPAGREAADAAPGTGTPAEREPVRAAGGRASTDADDARVGQGAGEQAGRAPKSADGAPADREAARPSAGSGPDAEADTTTGPGPKSGPRPGQKADPGTETAAGSGSGVRETTDAGAAGDGWGGPAGDASAQPGKDRPRPSWAKGDDPADGTAPARPERPRPSRAEDDTSARGGEPARAEDRPRPSWAKAPDEEGAPDGKGAPGPRRTRAGTPASGGGAGNAGKGATAQPHDPERTSEFVALKDPDAVRPPKPKPEPQPAQRPVLEPTRETPLPPLELLAELTNTAPPPETPRRTLTRRVKVWTPIVLLLGVVVAGAQMLRPLPAPTFVTDRASHTIEGTTTIPWPAKGQAAVRFPGSGVISTFGEQKPVPTASVGKVMTAYVILKNHPLRKDESGPGIEIDAKAVAEGKSEDESRIKDLTLGQKFSEQDMLKMMMIPSANNIARQLARWDSGNDEAAFVAKMNAAARELGMRDTTYTDPSGLDAGTVSTAVDQLKLAEAVMREEAFREIVELASSPVKGRTQTIDNNNTLLSVRGLGAVGIKTGSSTPAGGTLMWAADKKVGGESPLILGVMMDQRVDGPDPNAAKSLELVLNNSRKIIEAVRKALAPATVIRKGQLVGHVSDGLGGSTPLVATKDLTVIGVPGQQLRLSLGAGARPLPHEAKAGTEVGVLTVGDGEGAKTVPVAVGADLVEPSFGTRVTRLS